MSHLEKLLNNPLAFLRDARFRQLTSSKLRRSRKGEWHALSAYLALDNALAEAGRLGPDVRFVYFPWIEGHGDALMRRLDCADLRIAPVPLFSRARTARERVSIIRAVRAEPELYRRLCLRVLLKLPPTVRGILLTMDWAPVMRELALACKEAPIPTILVPHEGMFADRARYYTDLATGANCPICDHACVWGPLQAKIFEERGYPSSRMTITGAPKFDPYSEFEPELTREQFCRVYRLDPARPIVLFACQPLDSQYRKSTARRAQVQALSHLADYCQRHQTQLLVREPPNAEDVTSNLMTRYRNRHDIQFDWAPNYLTGPEESVYHSAVVCSINSTMMFEAALLGRPALSTKYVAFDSLWEQMGGLVASRRPELESLLDRCLSDHPPLLATGRDSALAQAFSAGLFDGQAVSRVRGELSRLAATPPSRFQIESP